MALVRDVAAVWRDLDPAHQGMIKGGKMNYPFAGYTDDDKLLARLRTIPTFADLKHFLGVELLPATGLPNQADCKKAKVSGGVAEAATRPASAGGEESGGAGEVAARPAPAEESDASESESRRGGETTTESESRRGGRPSMEDANAWDSEEDSGAIKPPPEPSIDPVQLEDMHIMPPLEDMHMTPSDERRLRLSRALPLQLEGVDRTCALDVSEAIRRILKVSRPSLRLSPGSEHAFRFMVFNASLECKVMHLDELDARYREAEAGTADESSTVAAWVNMSLAQSLTRDT